jgi:hypothetical protein
MEENMDKSPDIKYMQCALDKIGEYLSGEAGRKFKKEEVKEAEKEPVKEEAEEKEFKEDLDKAETKSEKITAVLTKAHKEAKEPEHKGKGKSFESFFGKK